VSAGYYYNVTFVQLGLLDLGSRHVGLSRAGVSTWMAVLAVVTFLVAVGTGVVMDCRGWSRDLTAKLRVLFGVVVVQLVLTAVAPFVRTVPAFGGWILLASASMGVGFPATFALTIDFVPVRDRGYVAATATALTYFLANAAPIEWRVEPFAAIMVGAMLPGAVVLGVLAFRDVGFVAELADQHESFGRGRFCRPTAVSTLSLPFWLPVVLMFGVFFVDSLGFLRIVETPTLLRSSWQSPELATRLSIGAVHVVGALIAGVLYTAFDRRWLFLLVFGFFAFTHLLYTFELRVDALFPALGGEPSPLTPLVYAAAVSFYTTLNFALWPDLSTPETIGTHSALGVGFAGFFATFLSTAVALYLEGERVGLLSHLNLVNALALLLFVGLATLLYVGRAFALVREGGDGEPS
jgi:hypothetical protein